MKKWVIEIHKRKKMFGPLRATDNEFNFGHFNLKIRGRNSGGRLRLFMAEALETT